MLSGEDARARADISPAGQLGNHLTIGRTRMCWHPLSSACWLAQLGTGASDHDLYARQDGVERSPRDAASSKNCLPSELAWKPQKNLRPLGLLGDSPLPWRMLQRSTGPTGDSSAFTCDLCHEHRCTLAALAPPPPYLLGSDSSAASTSADATCCRCARPGRHRTLAARRGRRKPAGCLGNWRTVTQLLALARGAE